MQVTGPRSTVPTEALPLCPFSQPVPQGPKDQELQKSIREEVEDRDVLSQKEAENVIEEVKNTEEEEAAAGGFHSDWTRGSVRRVTRQLEQRLKQEHEAPSLSSSPSSLSGSSYSLRRPHSVHLMTASNPQEASVCLQVSVVSSVQEEEDDGNVGLVKKDNGAVVEMRAQGNKDGGTKGPRLRPADTRLFSTSSFRHAAVSPFASVNFLCLEGVTELESGTDWDSSAEEPQCDIIMRETWETLCELGAFLQQVSVGGAFKPRCVDRGFGFSARTTRKRGCSVQKRVSEVEARIRQAGLTPPSLMKRSASLAKLGCLELLANDLSELSRSPVAPSSNEPPIHTVNDESKKQRVQHSPSSASQRPDGEALTGAESLSEAGLTSPPPPEQNLQGGLLPNSDQDSLYFPGLMLKTTRQQYGRTHPLRRLKKRITSTLYHTM